MKEQKPIEEEEEEDLEFSAEREALKFWSSISSSSISWKKTRSCRLSGRRCDLADVSGFASGLAAAAQDCGDDGSKEKRGRRKR